MALRRTSSEDLISNVETAAGWAGLPNTRVKPLLQQLRAALATRTRRPTRDTLLIIEASTIADVHFLWSSRHADYPGLLRKIRNSVASGPLLPDDEERGKSHAEPRNNRFTYLLAGCLLKGGAPVVSIEGIARQGLGPASPTDIVLDWENRRVPIECKRPFDMTTLHKTDAVAPECLARIRGGACLGGRREPAAPSSHETYTRERVGTGGRGPCLRSRADGPLHGVEPRANLGWRAASNGPLHNRG